MEGENLKQTVLMDLRSVIQSCKGGVPLNRLQNDCKLLIGKTIPFTQLGYSSLETFLQSVPHVVKLKKDSDGRIFVEAVADSSTAHLQNLISKQKSTKTQKCSVKRYGKNPAPKQKFSLCPTCACTKSAFTNSNGAHSSISSSWSSVCEVPDEKDKEIEALNLKLAGHKEMNATLKSRVNQLLAQSEPNLEDEQLMIQRIKYQIGLLQKRILLRHAASPGALLVIRNINEIDEKIGHLDGIVEKLTPHSRKDNSLISDRNVQQVSKDETSKLNQQECQETEELKKQVQLHNSQIQSIEKRMQSQLQKLQNQISTVTKSTPSLEQLKSEILNDLKNQLQEQNVQIQNVERNMALEIDVLKNQVVHLNSQSEKLNKFEKEQKRQNSLFLSADSKMQSNFQKLKNKLDTMNLKNMIDMIVKALISGKFLDMPQVLSSLSNCRPDEQMQQPPQQLANSPVSTLHTSVSLKRRGKKKSKASESVPSNSTGNVREMGIST